MSEFVLNCPEYITYDPIGRMIAMRCKCCGAPIGEDRDGAFIRFKNYAEMKMRFLDKSMHVTNGCTDCIALAVRSSEMRTAMHQADIDDMVKQVPEMAMFRNRLGSRVVAVDYKRMGIP